MNPVDYKATFTADTGAGPSPSIWADCPLDEIRRSGQSVGIVYDYDFAQLGKLSSNINAAEAAWAGGLYAFGSDGASIALADAQGGGLTVGSDGDNEGISFRDPVPAFQIARGKKKLWFEIRLKCSTVADTKFGFLTGLIENVALTATVPIAAAGTLADQNFVGWHRLEGDGDAVDAVYKANGVTQVTAGTDLATLAADTYIKLGMVWDPLDSYLLKWFANGVQVDTYTMASADGTDFPNDVRLGFFFALLNATGTTPGTATLSWARVAQLL